MVGYASSCFTTKRINVSNLNRIIVGNVVIHPALAEFLKRSCYYMGYDPDKELITLFANDGGGGQDLMQIRNASHENALKLAKELGLKTQNLDQDHACSWDKYCEVLHFYHNGSEEAEWLRIEIFKLGIPCRVRKIVTEKPWALHMCQGSYGPTMWTVKKLLKEIKERNFNKKHEPTLDIN